MALICPDQHLLFIMAPRTGCTAVGKVLREHLGGTYLPAEAIRDEAGEIVVDWKHSTLAQLLEHGLLSPEERSSLLVFTAVRNPFDSLVSLYVKRHTRPSRVTGEARREASLTFDEWIASKYGSRPADLIRRRRRTDRFAHPDGVDHVMRFERLQESFDEVLRHAQLDPLPIPLFNTTEGRGRDYRSYYSDRSRRLVERAWAEDLERYGYTF